MNDEYKAIVKLISAIVFLLFFKQLSSQPNTKDSIDRLIAQKRTKLEQVQCMNLSAEQLADKNTSLAAQYALDALAIAEANNLQQEKGKALNNLAWIKYRNGDFTAAFDYSTKALKWNERNQFLPELAASYRCMASVFNSQGNTNKSIEFFKKDWALHTKLHNDKSIGRALNNLTFTFYRGKLLDSAFIYSEKALAFNKGLKDAYLMSFAYRNAGDLSLEKKQIDSAKYYFRLSEQFAVKANSIQLQLTALYRVGRLLNEEKNYAASIPYLEKALQLGINMGAKSETALIYQLLATAYEGEGQYQKAFTVQKQASILNDSLYQQKSRTKLAEMQAKFEAEKKESEINQLKKEKAQQLDNNQKKTILNISLIGTVFVVIIMLIVIARKNKYKSATNLVLESQKQTLEETILLKDKIFSIVSHDLRSPIASLNSVLPMLDPSSMDHDTYAQLKNDLTKQVQNLNYVLDNLLIWSRSQMKGIVSVNKQSLNLNKQASYSVELLTGLAQQKQIEVTNLIVPSLHLVADSQHVDIIIRNILLNAVKFTSEKGQISLYSEQTNEAISLHIQDSGVGMNPDQINRLFQLKTHFTTPGTQKEKGTGLGLLICAEYAAANQWQIQVNSQIGKGSIFSIIFPNQSNEQEKHS